MFAEPETRSNSDDGSREGSIDGVKRLKKSSKPKTRFSICHPPPESKVKQKFHRRPRSLLQLHRLSATARPFPALEVIPSANFSVRMTRAITKVFKAKHGLCPNDLVVLKAEKYSHEEEDEEKEARDVVGLICRGRKEDERAASGRMLIHMATGQQWEAYATPSGGYECCTTDEHGLSLTVRWVPKKGKDGNRFIGKDGAKRFNFSTISPNSRRHPVIATLSKTSLEVNDVYRMPDATSNTPLSTPKAGATILEDAMDDEIGGKDMCHTDEQLREIITMTGIWVAFKEGWSPSFKYDEKRDSEPTVVPGSPARSASGVVSPPGSPANFAQLEKRASIKSFGSGVIRRASLLSRSNRNSTISMSEDGDSPAPSRNNSVNLGPAPKTGRTRADSSSTVLVHRAASNRRKNNQTSSFKADLIISNDLHETSKEDLAQEFKTSTVVPNIKKNRSPLSRQASVNPPVSSDDEETPPTPTKTRSISMTPEKLKHRESNTTTETRPSIAAARQQQHPIPTIKRKRKGRGWRKILCGASSAD